MSPRQKTKIGQAGLPNRSAASSEKKMMSRRSFVRNATAAAFGLRLLGPSLLRADEKKVRVQCRTFSNPNLFKPFINKASGMVKKFQGYDVPVDTGEYTLVAKKSLDGLGGEGTVVEATVNATQEKLEGIIFMGKLSDVRYIIDKESKAPALSQAVLIHDRRDAIVYFRTSVHGVGSPQYVSEKIYSRFAETRGPTQTGYSNDGGLEVYIHPPGELQRGDVVTIKGVRTNGKKGTLHMMYDPSVKDGTIVQPGTMVAPLGYDIPKSRLFHPESGI